MTAPTIARTEARFSPRWALLTAAFALLGMGFAFSHGVEWLGVSLLVLAVMAIGAAMSAKKPLALGGDVLEVHGLCKAEHDNIPARIVVAADGFLVEPLVGFRSFADVERVQRRSQVVIVHMRSGKMIRLSSPLKNKLLLDWLLVGLERFQRRYAGDDEASIVERRDRSTAEWMRSLRALTARTDYREAHVDRDRLWRIVENPAAPGPARAAAATALSGALDEPERARIRVAARASASPRVRVALEAAASPDDEALAEALEACAKPQG